MTPEEWSKVKALFDEALDLEPGEPRNRFLASIDSQASRAEVKRLLSLHEAESAIFDRLQPDPQLIRSASELRSLNAGDLIAGRFRIVRFVAEGGMGEVYEAQDEQLNERVAVKTLRFETAQDSSALARFRQEIQLARRVTHPNVCRIHDLWEHKTAGGRSIWFLTMEFLEGETLARRIERGSMPVAEVLPLVQQMAAGLGAAHEAGIVHRDFKSSNVILVPRSGSGVPDRAVVTDFGLSRSFDVRTTASGAVMGTPAYMAPEQIEGGELGPATDLYALGVVMYEMLTGMLPFRSASPMALAVKKIRETPRPPSHLVQGLPTVWDQVVMRCMQYRMDERFQTAAAVMDAIETGKLPSLRGPDLQLRVPARWWKLALVLLVLAAGGGYWFWGRERGFNAKPEAVSLYREGVARLNEAAPNRAQALFERALTVDPEFVVVRARLAQSLAEQEMVDAARDELLKIGNEAVSGLRKRDQTLIEGIRATALRDYPKAIRWFGEIAGSASSEEVPEALLDLAKAQLSGNEPAKAIETCSRAINVRKDFAGAMLVRSRANSLRGEAKAAQQDLKSASAQFDLHGSLDGVLAASVQRIGDLVLNRNLDESEAEVRSSLALVRPPFVNHYQEIRLRLLLAGVLRLKAKYSDAIHEAETALEIARRNGQFVPEVAIQNDLGSTSFAQFNYEGAEAHHRQAMKLASQYRLAYQEARSQMHLATVLFRQQKIDEGKQFIDRAGEYFRKQGLGSEFRQLRLLQINAAIDSYHNQDALELAQSLLADAERNGSDADRTQAYLSLGHLALVEGDLFQSIEYSRSAQRIAAKSNQNVLNNMLNELRQHNELGDLQGAIEGLEAVWAGMKANPQALKGLESKLLLNESRLNALEGRWDEAVRLMRAARTAAQNDIGRADVDVLGARLLAISGKTDEALTLAERARDYFKDKGQLDSRVKCECASAEVLLLAGRKQEAVRVAKDAMELGEGKVQRFGLWHCSLILAAASPGDARAQILYREQFEKLTKKWPAQGKQWLLARRDLQHLLGAVPAIKERKK